MNRETVPLATILQKLASDNWLEVGLAIRQLIPHGEAATVALPQLFPWTIHEIHPLLSYSRAVIRRLGKHAVPFLREQAANTCPMLRATAILLLMETGNRYATSSHGQEHFLRERCSELPDWGVDPEELIQHFRNALDDENREVRYRAASALEEFGRHIPETIPVFMETLLEGPMHQSYWAALHLGRIGPSAIAAGRKLALVMDYCEWTTLAAKNSLERIRPSETER